MWTSTGTAAARGRVEHASASTPRPVGVIPAARQYWFELAESVCQTGGVSEFQCAQV